MDAASNNHVDDVRALREQVGYATVRSRYRIWIVDEVHMLSTAAFNAFLKTLEEPPPGVKFFFCTTELHKLPETIRSRCIKVELRPVRTDAIVARLQWLIEREGLDVEPALPEAISASAQGGLRDAEALLEQLLAACPDGTLRVADLDRLCGRASGSHVDALLDAISDRDPAAALDAVDASLASGAKPGVLIEQWLGRFRDEMVTGAREATPRVAAAARAIDLLLDKRSHVRAGADGALVAQVAAVELARLPDARDVDALLDAVRSGSRRGAAPAAPSGDARHGRAPRTPSARTGESEAPDAGAAPPARHSAPGPMPRDRAPAARTPTPPAARTPTPPAARAPSPPGRPTGQPPDAHVVRARWAALVDDVRGRDPQLAQLLQRTRVSEVRGDRVVLLVDERAHDARTKLLRGEVQLLFGQASRRVWGVLLRPLLDASAGRENQPQPMDLRLRDHPVVQRVTEATGGRLVTIRTERASGSSNDEAAAP